MKKSEKVFFGLLGMGILCHILFLPYYPDSSMMMMNWIIIPIYGTLGYIGLKKCEEKAGFPDIFEESVNYKYRYLIPMILGVIFGVGAIIFDILNPVKVPALPLPISIPYWIFIAIFDEFFWRLFLLTFFIWLISYKILNGNKQEEVFWIMACIEALFYILLQISMFILNVGPITPILFAQIILISGVYTIFSCYCYKKGGFLAVLIMRLTQYLLYHIIYGSFLI